MNGFFIQSEMPGASCDLSGIEAAKIVIFPAGKMTRWVIKTSGLKNVAYICDNNESLHGSLIDGIPVVPVSRLSGESDPGLHLIVTSPTLYYSFIKQVEDSAPGMNWRTTCAVWPRGFAGKFYDDFSFTDRRRHCGKLLTVLAGYKQPLWNIVFKRIHNFAPDDLDVCILSSGLFSDELAEMCKTNGWSYLSTKKNSVTLIQNIAYTLHPNAGYIYKLDEDIFICDNFFKGLMDTFKYVEENTPYHVGFTAPLIPVNPHGNVLFLQKMGLYDEYTALFGKPYYDFCTHFQAKSEETLYLWEKTLPLDETARKFQDMPFSYYVCPHRFSIGAILFRRSVWEELGGFSVTDNYSGLGLDEYEFAELFLARINFYTMVVAENVLAGHYSFGGNADMGKLNALYSDKRELFDIS